MIKIAIFASGSGTNAENLINYFKNVIEIDVVLILSNKFDAFVLERAKKAAVKTFVFSPSDLKNTNIVINELIEKQIDWIVLAGFLLKIPKNLLERFNNKIINIHPALLPKYGGKGMYGSHVHNSIIDAGEKESGITIHFVNEIYDDGKIIFQTKVKISDYDTPETLANKIHALEYEHFPRVIHEVISSSQSL